MILGFIQRLRNLFKFLLQTIRVFSLLLEIVTWSALAYIILTVQVELKQQWLKRCQKRLQYLIWPLR